MHCYFLCSLGCDRKTQVRCLWMPTNAVTIHTRDKPPYMKPDTVTIAWFEEHKIRIWLYCGPGSSVGIATGYRLDGPGSNPDGGEIFRTCPDRPWGPPRLPYKGYRVFPGGKVRPGRAADHSPPSSAAIMEE